MITAGIDMGSRTVKVVLIDTAAAGAPSVKKTHLMFPGDLDGDAAATRWRTSSWPSRASSART